MGKLGFIIAFVLFFAAFMVLGAAVTKFMWWLTGMGDWTGMGFLPWGPSFFISMIMTGASCTLSSKR